MKYAHSRGERGFGFVELMISIVVIAIATATLISHLAVNYASVRAQRDRVFAFSVAESIQSEILALAAESAITGEALIDQLDDGASTVPTLSIAEKAGILVAPDHEISGNYQRNGRWMWTRRINVAPLSTLENRKLRYVTVRVFKVDPAGNEHEVASISSIVSTLVYASPSTQVFDLYLLAIDNIPGMWMHAESMLPFVMRTIREIEQNNPGLEFRTHWITKASYGRNPLYRPYVNEGVDSLADTPEVYYYPGLMPTGSASIFHYVPSLLKGRIRTETGQRNGYDAATNPYPYALADYYNNSMRLPMEREFHDKRIRTVRARKAAIAQAVKDGTAIPPELQDMSEEPTLRLFMEDLASDPQKYENALIVNLHGEMLPMPALRNFSDAAKDPLGLPNLRVVAHPEELRTQRPPSLGVTDARLRVHAYVTDPDTHVGSPIMPVTRPITIQVMDLDLTDGSQSFIPGVTLENLRGGVVVGGTNDYFPMLPAKKIGDPTLVTDEMYYEVDFVDPGAGQRKYTLIKLYNTPVIAPPVIDALGTMRGLNNTSSARLYGLEYIPTCTGVGLDFSDNLFSPGNASKNTARWVLKIPGTVFADKRWVDMDSPPNYFDPNLTADPDRVLTFRTRIWNPALADPMESGTVPGGTETRWIQPENLSETYTWWAGTRDAVPITERSQFQGDPRHNPYKDLLRGDADFPDGYNRYFDALVDGLENAIVSFPGIDPALQGAPWQGMIQQDLPRFFEVLRTALVRSRTFATAMTGWTGLFVGHGNDIGGYAMNGYPGGIPTDLSAFGSPGTDGLVDHLLGPRHFVRDSSAGYWWGMPWLGELFPDSAYASQWFDLDPDGHPRGNLDAGTGVGEFYHWPTNSVHSGASNKAYGTRMLMTRQIAGPAGSAALFNIGSTASSLHHVFAPAGSNLVDGGLELTSNYVIGIDPNQMADRPFDLTSSGAVGEHFDDPPYSTDRYDANLVREIYSTGGSTASGIIEWLDHPNRAAGYFVATGLEKDDAEARQITELSVLGLVHSYMESGELVRPYPNKRLPRAIVLHPTEITELSDPATIDVQWDIEWTRWDGDPYVAATPVGFTDNEAEIEYAILYSKDSGETWAYVQDDTEAFPGVRPDPAHTLADSSAGQETYVWTTDPVDFPRGTYLLRVEAYRQGQNLHYAYHEKLINIDR